MSGKLYFTVGLPRSGKTTVANKWMDYPIVYLLKCQKTGMFEFYGPTLDETLYDFSEYIKIDSKKRIVICGDDFRKGVHGMDFSPLAESFVFAAMDVATRVLLSRGHDVLIDETCTTKDTLLRYLKIDTNAIPILVDTNITACKNRAISTQKDYLLGPIQRMHGQLIDMKKNYIKTRRELEEYLKKRKEMDVIV